MRLDREALRGRAQTVLGTIDPAELGPTLMHEHLLWDIRTPAMRAEADQGPDISLCNCFAINYGRKKAARQFPSVVRGDGDGRNAADGGAGGTLGGGAVVGRA